MAVETVTFPEALGGTGETFTNDSNPATGFGSGGYVTRFFRALANVILLAQTAVNAAAAAVSARDQALTAAVVTGTSASSVAIADSGSAVFVTQSGKPINQAMYFRAASRANPATHWVEGWVTSYAGTSLTLQLVAKGSGSGSRTDWDLALAPTATGAVQTLRTVATSGLASGGGDLSDDRTINVPAASGTETKLGVSSTKAVTPSGLKAAAAFVGLTDQATIAWNAAADGGTVEVILGANRTFGAPTNLSDGVSYVIAIIQDATGGRTLAWNALFDWGEDGPPALSTGAGKVDYAFGLYKGSRNKLEMSFRKAAA